MNRRSFVASLIAVPIVLSIRHTYAGGWAVVELARPVPTMIVNTPATIEFRILQHAEPDHALEGATPVITLKHRDSQAITTITGTAKQDAPAIYEATLLLEAAGEYKWNIAAEPFPATAMPTLHVFGTAERARAFERTTKASSTIAEVSILDSSFLPATIEITPGTTVRWTNSSPLPHQVVWTDLDLDDSALLAQEEVHEMTFNEPGTFSYFCGPHPYMIGEVVVAEDGQATPAP